MLKKCTKCGEEKTASADYFYVDRSTKDGLNRQCKSCINNYQIERKKKIQEELIQKYSSGSDVNEF